MNENSTKNFSTQCPDSERIAALELQIERVARVTNQLIAETVRLTAESAALKAAVIEIFSTPLVRRR